jgi:hypothetical protein
VNHNLEGLEQLNIEQDILGCSLVLSSGDFGCIGYLDLVDTVVENTTKDIAN